jgi:phage terminase small subunit
MPFIDFSNLTRDQWAAINSVETDRGLDLDKKGEPTGTMVGKVKFKLHDKRAALNDLGRYLKMFVDKVEHSGNDGGPIEFTFSLDRASSDDEDGAGA